jgi:hypothetical protein
MSIYELENFYKATITKACSAGATNIYVSTKPTPTNGILVISPGTESLREIIKYTGTGTDGDGDYVTVLADGDRGLGGTIDQTHEISESVRMNYTAEHQKEIDDTINAIVSAGAPNSSTTVKGIVKLSSAPVSATEPIAVGDNDPRIGTEETLLTSDEKAALAGGGEFGTPDGDNKFLTEDFLGAIVDVQEFTSSGTWTKPDKGTFAIVEEIGGGGGGALAYSTSIRIAATGGGGGVYRKFIIKLSDLNATESVVIGAGGAARTGTTAQTTAGNAGGNTSFKGIIASGGGGGAAGGVGSSGTTIDGGVGATTSSFGQNGGNGGSCVGLSTSNAGTSTEIAGAGGGSAINSASLSNGGASILMGSAGGNGARGTSGAVTATSGVKGGGGGGVAVEAANGAATATSGAGGDGYVRVTVI